MAGALREGAEPIEGAAGRLHGGRRDVGVDGGGLEVAVSEQHLDRPDVGAGLEQVGGEAVPQGMDGDVLVQAGGPSGLDADPVHGADGDGPPGTRPGKSQSVGRAAFQYSRSRVSSRGESMT